MPKVLAKINGANLKPLNCSSKIVRDIMFTIFKYFDWSQWSKQHLFSKAMIFQNYVSSVQISYFVQIHHTSAFASGFGFLIHLCFTSRMRMRMEFLGKELWLSNTMY